MRKYFLLSFLSLAVFFSFTGFSFAQSCEPVGVTSFCYDMPHQMSEEICESNVVINSIPTCTWFADTCIESSEGGACETLLTEWDCESGDGSNYCNWVGPVCGNGAIEGDEECDDGNGFSDDGCSVVCTVDPGWTCIGEPSVCTEELILPSGGMPQLTSVQVTSLITKMGTAFTALIGFFVDSSLLWLTLSAGLIVLLYLYRFLRYRNIDFKGVSNLSNRIKRPSVKSKI